MGETETLVIQIYITGWLISFFIFIQLGKRKTGSVKNAFENMKQEGGCLLALWPLLIALFPVMLLLRLLCLIPWTKESDKK